MKLSVEVMSDHILIKCNANFDAQLVSEAKAVFTKVIEHVDRKVVLDISKSPFLDYSAIGVISFLFKRLKRLGLTLEIIGLQQQPMQLLNQLQVSDVIPCRAC